MAEDDFLYKILFLLSILDHLMAIIECVVITMFLWVTAMDFLEDVVVAIFLGFLSVDFNFHLRSRVYGKNALANFVSGSVLQKSRFL